MEGFWYRDGTLSMCSWDRIFLPPVWEAAAVNLIPLLKGQEGSWSSELKTFRNVKILFLPLWKLYMTQHFLWQKKMKDLPYFIMAQNKANKSVCTTWQLLPTSISCWLAFFNMRKWSSFVPESVNINFKSGIVPEGKLVLLLCVTSCRISFQRNGKNVHSSI